MKNLLFVIFFLFIVFSCSKNSNKKTLFISHPKSTTGINFSNILSYTEELNPYTYRNFYNGGGVGIGDFNNDSLPDVFFTGNLGVNPIEKIMDKLGEMALRLIIITLFISTLANIKF